MEKTAEMLSFLFTFKMQYGVANFVRTQFLYSLTLRV